MCGRFTQYNHQHLAARLHIANLQLSFSPRYNLAPTQQVFGARAGANGLEPAMFKWGLIPSWAKDAKIASSTINARSETVASKPSFRSAYKRRRCLIPADGYFEWKPGEGKKKTPFYIQLKSGAPIVFAGLWESWTNPDGGEVIESCTILTTEANDILKPFHDRMPVMLAEADFDAWLDTTRTDTEKLFKPQPSKLFGFYEVSTDVNKPKIDNARLIEPVAAEEGEVNLFA